MFELYGQVVIDAFGLVTYPTISFLVSVGETPTNTTGRLWWATPTLAGPTLTALTAENALSLNGAASTSLTFTVSATQVNVLDANDNLIATYTDTTGT